MEWSRFVAKHEKGLRLNEVQHGVLISAMLGSPPESYWSFGRTGKCAVQPAGRAIILGSLDQKDCRELAELTIGRDYPGVLGPGLTTHWFAGRACELGIHFHDCEPQQIYVLREPPRHPRVPGQARMIHPDEIDLFRNWLIQFSKEANPFDNIPDAVEAAEIALDGRFIFWDVDSQPVSMAAVTRRLRTTEAITGVYTPPELRGRGYAAAITAVVADQIIARGLVPTLYTDLRNPASNRCYSRLGFEPGSPSFHYHR